MTDYPNNPINPDDIPESVPEEFEFPKTVKQSEWIKFLGRSLTRREKFLIQDLKSEHRMNERMQKLYQNCNGKNMYVPVLTNLIGDCMFESLVYHKIGYDVETLRKGLAHLLYIFQDYDNLFPTNDMALKKLFELFNEVEYVCRTDVQKYMGKVYRTQKFYKYTYDVVCQDISGKYSWSKLPTQMILMFVSYLYKVNIIIVSDETDYEINVNIYEDMENPPPLRNIYLGHLGELHYVPIDVLKDDEEIDPMYYIDAKTDFIKWGKQMELEVYSNHLMRQRMRNNFRGYRTYGGHGYNSGMYNGNNMYKHLSNDIDDPMRDPMDVDEPNSSSYSNGSAYSAHSGSFEEIPHSDTSKTVSF